MNCALKLIKSSRYLYRIQTFDLKNSLTHTAFRVTTQEIVRRNLLIKIVTFRTMKRKGNAEVFQLYYFSHVLPLGFMIYLN